MARYWILSAFLLLVACRDKESGPPLQRQSRDAASADVPADAPPTSRFVDLDGAPSEDILAFCRASQPKVRELGPGVRLSRYDGDGCLLSFDHAPTDDGLISVLRTISMSRLKEEARVAPHASLWDKGSAVDQRHRLTMAFEIIGGGERVLVSWDPYEVPEAIIGTEGRLLAGVDVAEVLGRPSTSLRKAISREYEIKTGCNGSHCVAYGPRFPGGYRVEVVSFPGIGRMLVTFSTRSYERELWSHVRELVAAALGPEQQGPDTDLVFVKDGLRYSYDEDSSSWVTIVIQRAEK